MAAELVFVDTKVIVAASVEGHPSHALVTAYLERLAKAGAGICFSTQVCREFMVVLTRGPVENRSFEPPEALAVLAEWRGSCVVLEDSELVLADLLALVRRYSVRGKQIHDANIVASMRAHGITRLATLNVTDFRRFEDLIVLETFVS